LEITFFQIFGRKFSKLLSLNKGTRDNYPQHFEKLRYKSFIQRKSAGIFVI